MNNKSIRRNLIPATAIATGGTLFSQVETDTYSRGIRLIITVASVTATGTNDSLWLCAVNPASDTAFQTQGGAAPANSALIPLTGPVAANMLSVAGTYAVDFYPGAWLPSSGVASGFLLGAFGVTLPIRYAVKITMGAGNAATVTVDTQLIP